MKKIIFAIFAHPDDESFGASGTLLSEARAGTDLHFILLTNGAAGMNPDNHDDLGAIRLQEWQAAGRLIGATGMHHLGYDDGQLHNQAMIDISERVIELISKIIESAPQDAEIELMSNDLNGITGHIDHIVAARTACFVHCHFKKIDPRFTRLRLACICKDDLAEQNTDWIFMEAGRTDDEIDETIDASALREDILAIIRTHHTQRSDGENLIAHKGERLGIEHFIVRS